MGNKFKSHFDAVEQELKSSTIGLYLSALNNQIIILIESGSDLK